MSDFRPTPVCPKCKAFLWEWEAKLHRCPPMYEVVCDEFDPEEVFEVYASDVEAAVEKWAEEFDREDTPDIADGSTYKVHVKAPNGVSSWWEVSGEWIADYTASQIT